MGKRARDSWRARPFHEGHRPTTSAIPTTGTAGAGGSPSRRPRARLRARSAPISAGRRAANRSTAPRLRASDRATDHGDRPRASLSPTPSAASSHHRMTGSRPAGRTPKVRRQERQRRRGTVTASPDRPSQGWVALRTYVPCPWWLGWPQRGQRILPGGSAREGEASRFLTGRLFAAFCCLVTPKLPMEAVPTSLALARGAQGPLAQGSAAVPGSSPRVGGGWETCAGFQGRFTRLQSGSQQYGPKMAFQRKRGDDERPSTLFLFARGDL